MMIQQDVRPFFVTLSIGIVLVSPMVAISEETKPHPCVVWCLQQCLLRCCKYAKLVPNALEENLTENELARRRMDENPLFYDQALPICTGDQLLRTTMSIQERVKELRMPIMICHGDKDIVTDCELSRTFYRKCGCAERDKTLKVYEGSGHLLYEEAPEVFRDSAQWMLRRLSDQVIKGNEHEEEVLDLRVPSSEPLVK